MSPNHEEPAPPPAGPASFATQMNALMRKNATLQMRNKGTNICLVVLPLLLCLFLMSLQYIVNQIADPFRSNDINACENQLFDMMGGRPNPCPVPHPARWPPLFQMPRPEFRATAGSNTSSADRYRDLPKESCRAEGSCPVTILITGRNRSLAQSLGRKLYGSEPLQDPSDSFDPLSISSNYMVGTSEDPANMYYVDPAFGLVGVTGYIVQPKCKPGFGFSVSVEVGNHELSQAVECVRGLQLWRNSSSDVNDELFTGYREGNSEEKTNEFLAAYDFLNTGEKAFNVTVWHNGTYKEQGLNLRILRAVNVASNSYLQVFRGAHVKMLLDFVKEMAKGETGHSITNISTLLGPLFFTWVIQLLFPVMLIYLVYEKQNNLRMIMKMHGLGDLPYWIITYGYFLLISSFYMLSFVGFGSIIGLKSFTLNDYSVQLVFHFLYINLQIALAFLVSTFFSDVKTASVVGYIYVFGSGLLGSFLFERLVQDTSSPRKLIQIMEIFPGFSLYRGLYELSEYAFEVEYLGSPHMSWKDVINDKQGMQAVLLIMIVEWPILLVLACYLDQVVSNGSGVWKHALWFFPCFRGRPKRNMQSQGYDVLVNMEKTDVYRERELVERLVREACKSHVIICDNLKKVYPKRDGNPEKHAVRGLSLALPQGECFGMLGPNGAGKTSFINMMTGLTTPTSGTAFVQRLDISKDMDKVYTSMGVCPQHDLIWETLTGREHLLFYGRLKNLKGAALKQAVEGSLRRVNLLDKGVADKLAKTYSGGMKRRLSVAISLIGNPTVVYMDEPSTGLDPASRKNLWKVVQCAKKDKAIVLTTHSMEEAEFLCDRVGIFVDGNLQCLGNPKELRARYGGFYVFTMTTPSDQEEEVVKLAHRLSPRANKVYHLSGTQKFQLPKEEAKPADVFREVEEAKGHLTIRAWGLSDATLEDVFIKVARGAQSIYELS